MSARFLLNLGVGLHLASGWGGAVIGGYEAYSSRRTRYFSNPKDDFYTASARGLIRGVSYPYTVVAHVPKVWSMEKPPWV